jgi:predicted HTH domain antitoxin
VENNQVDNQLNEIDPKVNDENELVLELYEHELVKLNHFVELNFPNPNKFKKLLKNTKINY